MRNVIPVPHYSSQPVMYPATPMLFVKDHYQGKPLSSILSTSGSWEESVLDEEYDAILGAISEYLEEETEAKGQPRQDSQVATAHAGCGTIFSCECCKSMMSKSKGHEYRYHCAECKVDICSSCFHREDVLAHNHAVKAIKLL